MSEETTTPPTFRVLVVDDDPDVREVVVELLQSQGYEAYEAGSGREGVEAARRARPHLILMDFNMPDLGGLEAVALLRQDPATRRIPVVAFTSGMGAAANQLSSAGCIGYIPKPIDPSNFGRIIKEFISVTTPRSSRTNDDVR